MQLIFPQMLQPELVGRSPVECTKLRYSTDYVSWLLGDKLRIVMSSIMRWRRGEIGLVIGRLLSVGTARTRNPRRQDASYR